MPENPMTNPPTTDLGTLARLLTDENRRALQNDIGEAVGSVFDRYRAGIRAKRYIIDVDQFVDDLETALVGVMEDRGYLPQPTDAGLPLGTAARKTLLRQILGYQKSSLKTQLKRTDIDNYDTFMPRLIENFKGSAMNYADSEAHEIIDGMLKTDPSRNTFWDWIDRIMHSTEPVGYFGVSTDLRSERDPSVVLRVLGPFFDGSASKTTAEATHGLVTYGPPS